MPDSNSYHGQPPTPPTAVIVSNGFALYPEKAFAAPPFPRQSLPSSLPRVCACPAITTNLAYINSLTDITLPPPPPSPSWCSAKLCKKFLDKNHCVRATIAKSNDIYTHTHVSFQDKIYILSIVELRHIYIYIHTYLTISPTSRSYYPVIVSLPSQRTSSRM